MRKSHWLLERQVRRLARRKIIYVIVEGPSDDEALGVILQRLFAAQEVFVEITHGDITSDRRMNAGRIVSKVGELVKAYAKSNHYTQSDFLEVIHIMDTDGAYISDDRVVKNATISGPRHTLTSIETNRPDQIIERNHRKSSMMDRLQVQNKVWTSIPYRAYYMSCNLDHVLYDKLNSSDEDKEKNAYRFAMKYKDHLQDFLRFICDSDFSAVKDYSESWNFIHQDLHSLERHSNLGLCFESIRQNLR